jgi:hypothetical protein
MRSVFCLLVIGLPLSAGCDTDNRDECSSTQVEKRLTVETPADPALQLRVESCRVDVDACPSLCELALARVNIGTFGVNACTVGFAGATVYMDVDYNATNPNCEFFGEGDIAVPQQGGGF